VRAPASKADLVRGRHPAYLAARLRAVTQRYGVTPRKAQERVRRCVARLSRQGISPTFATPGHVVESAPGFFRELRDDGVELAIHGYDHADFRRLSRQEAAEQFARALDAYARHGIPFEGFRCPYLSYTPDVRAVLPPGAFSYSSNRAIAWGAVGLESHGPVYAHLARNYRALSSDEALGTPTLEDGLVEVPASVPDDLQLCDALGLGPDGLLRVWVETLRETHRGGELFAPLFHPEAFDLLEESVDGLLQTARALSPAVWLTQLREVARWWRERAGFAVRLSQRDGLLTVDFDCSTRATVLGRGLPRANGRAWDDDWSVIEGRQLRIGDGETRPFIGASDVEAPTIALLREQGYVVDTGDRARECGIVLDRAVLDRLRTPRALIEHLEADPAPLVKYARWPDGARSALCLAGDLDALSLRDYAQRLRPASRRRR
jgi:hypothetical protein